MRYIFICKKRFPFVMFSYPKSYTFCVTSLYPKSNALCVTFFLSIIWYLTVNLFLITSFISKNKIRLLYRNWSYSYNEIYDFWYIPDNEIVGDILGCTPSFLPNKPHEDLDHHQVVTWTLRWTRRKANHWKKSHQA